MTLCFPWNKSESEKTPEHGTHAGTAADEGNCVLRLEMRFGPRCSWPIAVVIRSNGDPEVWAVSVHKELVPYMPFDWLGRLI